LEYISIIITDNIVFYIFYCVFLVCSPVIGPKTRGQTHTCSHWLASHIFIAWAVGSDYSG